VVRSKSITQRENIKTSDMMRRTGGQS
jgi:hypothetical protein